MSLQGAHRTPGETIHLVLLPSQQRTHQDRNTQAGFHITLRTDAAPMGRPAPELVWPPDQAGGWVTGSRFRWSCSTSLTGRCVGGPPSHADSGRRKLASGATFPAHLSQTSSGGVCSRLSFSFQAPAGTHLR